ncbi:MAG: DNA repair exonuclease [Oscillospiraceae bacterium]|nr:DNA repair exonuclease [Oscillospiraceae bacterium]
MAVKILHAADFHLDSPFSSLSEEKAVQRRQESRGLLSELGGIAEREGVQVMLLAGDLFDSGLSYRETQEAMQAFLSGVNCEVFIAPGNHDYWSLRSPYAFLELPENVHIFRAQQPKCVELPSLGCRVWGCAFTSPVSDDMLAGFRPGETELIDLMVLHASVGGDRYCPITEDEIAATGLDYLALGHVHAYSGIKKAGNVHYAYPGCLEGRGFDECGEKGYIIGTVDKGRCDLAFRPLAKRIYSEREVELTGALSAADAISAAIGNGEKDNIVRITLKGEFSGRVDTDELARLFDDKFYSLRVKDRTVPATDLWAGVDEDSLRGLFLSALKAKYDAASDERERRIILSAAKYGVAALDGREAWQP